MRGVDIVVGSYWYMPPVALRVVDCSHNSNSLFLVLIACTLTMSLEETICATAATVSDPHKAASDTLMAKLTIWS